MNMIFPPRQIAPLWTRGPWLPLLLLLLALLVRAQTFGNPVIEFDEQYYRLIGERMLDGAVPYLDIWDRKPVGLFLLFAGAAGVGGKYALSYQLMAALFVALTAWCIHAMARRVCEGWRGPMAAAVLYILWLNLLQGEGGQASVLYTLPMCAAALIVMRVLDRRGQAGLFGWGALAMLLVGLAAQIKYTVLFEGAFFGLMLLRAQSGRAGLVRLALSGLGWVAIAIAPTLLAWAVFAAMGHGQDWLFANFISIMQRAPMPLGDLLGELAGGLATIALLVIAAVLGWRRMGRPSPAARFLLGWAIFAGLALLGLRTFSPHYFIPLVPPLVLLATPALDRMARVTLGLIILAAVAGQAMVGIFIHGKGDGRTLAHMTAAIGEAPHCIFVFDGFPALYQATGSCLPSRYLFPSLLNGVMEADAIGVDPAREVTRIMASRPDAVILDEPRWSLRNLETNAIVDRELAAHYRLALREETGRGRFRLVYRVKPQDAAH